LKLHLEALKNKREQIDLLITNVQNTINATERNAIMNNNEKFLGFKQDLINENEKNYGKEIREKYGNENINASYDKMMGLSAEQYNEIQLLTDLINSSLKTAFEQGDPSSEAAQKVCSLHKKWLGYFWNHYSSEAHQNLVENYVNDPRFRKYYDKIAIGCVEFLRDAMLIFLKN